MDSLPNVGTMVSWHDKRLNRLRFGEVVQTTGQTVRVRAGDGKIHAMNLIDVSVAFQ